LVRDRVSEGVGVITSAKVGIASYHVTVGVSARVTEGEGVVDIASGIFIDDVGLVITRGDTVGEKASYEEGVMEAV